MKKSEFSKYIKSFDFKNLFNELGWDNFTNSLAITINEEIFELKGIAEKKGFVILHCPAMSNGKTPLSSVRKQIEANVAQKYFEHLIIYTNEIKNHQVWQIALKEENKPKQVRDISWYSHQDTDVLFQRLKNLLFTLDEEEHITIVDVKKRVSENFAKNTDAVTKKFYTEFKKQHTVFLKFIEGIDDHIGDKENSNKQWYASLMLNRLMFCYFIQKKGFLDQDVHYLGNKLNECKLHIGKDSFYGFYRSFLIELFHDGLGKPKKDRGEHPIDLGKVPYLNGGLFDIHELEKQFDAIDISDDAFEQLFSFFDQWNWHLDNRFEATGRDINPDVIGYIFEKYINDRASMGAYYTKEDITDYIGKNTIIPFLFDETERNYRKAFKEDSELWTMLKDSGDTYIYEAVKKGVPSEGALFADLPDEIKAGFQPEFEKEVVQESTSPHLWEIRNAWNTKAPEEIALPTELYRELIERRKRYAEIKSKIYCGEITEINDFITYNLNIRQFTQDFIENTTDPDFIRHFFKSIQKITILDPTCGSGAFLFAALNILEPLYEGCITRMEQFVTEESGKHKFFEETLEVINSDEHPNLQYYIFKNIILNNLHGVDIMNEAVEIAKLRLFLKLVATVDVNPRKENFGLEPLPDIDFNIRAGNTLIGFATEKELLETIQKKELLFAQDKLDDFKEEIGLVSKAYRHFQNAQLINDQGSESFKIAKADLNKRLSSLNHKLNIYLAANYGITDAEGKQKDKFKTWLTSHQPFHWFAEFYHIVAGNDGFDCIIGNPPYVEYSKVKNQYIIQNYTTENCGNLYAFVIERCIEILNRISRFGMIVPSSSFTTSRMEPLMDCLSYINNWFSFFDFRPGKLFDGVNLRLAICVSSINNSQEKSNYTSTYIRWYSEERELVFPNKTFYNQSNFRNKLAQKTSLDIEISILNKLNSVKENIANTLLPQSKHTLYFHDAILYWIRATDFPPSYGDYISSHVKQLPIKSESYLKGVCCIINSSLFYWYWTKISNCRDLTMKDASSFPVNLELLENDKYLFRQHTTLMKDLVSNGVEKTRIQKQTGEVKYLEFYPLKSKPIINKIDLALSKHFGLTAEELDFIINYDIKYRMGKTLFNEVDDEDDEE